MPRGLEVYNTDQTVFMTVTDRLTKFVTSGSYNLGTGQVLFVPVANMTADTDRWFISCTLGNIAVPGNGGFNLYQVGEYSGTTHYTVFWW